MKEFIEWLKRSLSHLWEGLLKNLGTAIGAFILSGGYLVAITKLQEFQQAVRRIPADYVLTPLVLLVVVAGALWNINRRQRKQLSQIQQQPQTADQPNRFVTHHGVWWRIYPDADYMEDFPYCPCCDPRKKLVQTEWHPDERRWSSRAGRSSDVRRSAARPRGVRLSRSLETCCGRTVGRRPTLSPGIRSWMSTITTKVLSGPCGLTPEADGTENPTRC